MNLSDFGVDGGRRKTLFIIGAEATRGASFVDDRTEMLPPLDLDFFQQLSRMPFSSPIQKDAERLLSFTREQFGSEVGLSMEQFLSEVEYTDRFHQEFNVDRGPIVKRYEKALGHFLAVLPEMFKRVCNEPCDYHDLLADALHTKDCVISFNYDCVMDDALKRNAFKRWDPQKDSYGFTPSGGSEAWRDHSEGRAVKNTIQLLKLHGSMNWNRVSDKDIELEEDLQQVESLEGSIIPPTWFKNLGHVTSPRVDLAPAWLKVAKVGPVQKLTLVQYSNHAGSARKTHQFYASEATRIQVFRHFKSSRSICYIALSRFCLPAYRLREACAMRKGRKTTDRNELARERIFTRTGCQRGRFWRAPARLNRDGKNN